MWVFAYVGSALSYRNYKRCRKKSFLNGKRCYIYDIDCPLQTHVFDHLVSGGGTVWEIVEIFRSKVYLTDAEVDLEGYKTSPLLLLLPIFFIFEDVEIT